MKSKGFTLIELVMAIVIGSIIFLTMMNIFIFSPRKSPRLQAMETALYLATSKIEEVSNFSFNSIASSGSTSFTGDFSDYTNIVEVHYVNASDPNISVDPTVTSYKWIKVTVNSTSINFGGVELITLVTDASN